MIHIFRNILIFCFLLAFELSAEASEHVLSSGKTVLVETLGKYKVQVRIKTHEIFIGKPSWKRPDKIESGCTYSRYPCSVVDIVEISVNGKFLFVPRSAFCSFTDLNTIEIHKEHQQFILTLMGGDASESYIGKIMFDQERITSRNLKSALDPDEILEETHYFKQVETFD